MGRLSRQYWERKVFRTVLNRFKTWHCHSALLTSELSDLVTLNKLWCGTYFYWLFQEIVSQWPLSRNQIKFCGQITEIGPRREFKSISGLLGVAREPRSSGLTSHYRSQYLDWGNRGWSTLGLIIAQIWFIQNCSCPTA